MCDIFDTDTVKTYKQITKLNSKNNCRITGDICSIRSLVFWFDKINGTIPSKLEIYNGRMFIDYESVKIIKLVSNKNLHKKYDKDNTLLLYFKDEDTLKKYRNLLGNTESMSSMINSYILDWSENKKLIDELKEKDSEYIEMNYYIFK